MKHTPNININTRTYWNNVYGDAGKRSMYEAQGTDQPVPVGNGMFACAQDTNRFIQALQYVKSGDKVIDMGCGVGVFTRYVKTKFPENEVWGTDISDTVIAVNKERDPDINYKQMRIGYQDELPDDYFDVVFSGETIEHLDEPKDLLSEAYRVLKEEGKFILTTPNEDHITSDEHVWMFTHQDIEDLFLGAGFKRVEFINLPDIEHVFVIFAVGYK